MAKSPSGASNVYVYEFREIDSIRVVGKEEPEQVFELLGRRGDVAQSILDLAERFALGLVAYRRRAWTDAVAEFRGAKPASDSAAIVTLLTWEESSRAAQTRPASNPWSIPTTSPCRLRSRAAFEAHQPVVGGVLICFAPRRDGERRVDEPVDRTTLVHHKLPDVD
jgi:hypothetical protein